MKREIIGRRFTRREREQYSTADGDDIPAALTRLVEHDVSASGTFADRIGAGLAEAKARLRASGLPDAPLLRWARGVIEPHAGPAHTASWTLPAFLQAQGFASDSREGIAGAIVWAEHVTRTASGTGRDVALLDLGALFLLADVYAQTEAAEAASRSNARKPRAGSQKVTDEMLVEYQRLLKTNKAGAAGIVARKNNVTATAIRAAAKKKKKT
jgi:hypothetical protein